jgi:hypothetical protein
MPASAAPRRTPAIGPSRGRGTASGETFVIAATVGDRY